ncbi:MAG TPA: hypothetical protein VHU91_08845 [Mycobacteriales bacterium]|jgi:mRNA-degrading endonuclease YafQ of YafQ-DinJ toxin-antitoxin module|nr:hypothetical protein [Mycobacteriales bacterium]
MPTYESLAAFQRQWEKLDADQREAFRQALAVFVANLKSGEDFNLRLRIHKLVNTELWSLSWAKDGRAVFRYGKRISSGETHIIWEAIGTHAEAYNFKK